MIVVVCTAIGVLSALWSWTRVRRLASLPLVHLKLVWIALIAQIVAFEGLVNHVPVWAMETVHYATYALCIVFIVLNRHLPGALLIAVGAAANLTAIVANGGSMPANMDAWRRAGRPPIPEGVFENSKALSNPRLGFLGDIFAIPDAWPLSNVFSIGDVVIVIGGTYLAHRWCARSPESQSEPGHELTLSAA